MYISYAITAICSVLFLTIGIDKFYPYLEPPCSMMNSIPPTVWKSIGGLQLAAGILIWLPKLRKYVAGFFVVFLLSFSIFHLMNSTYDIGGSVFMAVLLGILVWNPSFMKRKKN